MVNLLDKSILTFSHSAVIPFLLGCFLKHLKMKIQLDLLDEFNNDDYQHENARFVFLVLNGFRMMLECCIELLA